MNRLLSVFLFVGLVGAVSVNAQPQQPFTPGNLVLVDAAEDRLIEVELDLVGVEPDSIGEAHVVQVVKWPLGDTSRRRPLGVAFDPNGTAYVGITSVPTSATEQVEFPAGRGEILQIHTDGSIDFHILPPEVTKGTWVSSFNANEVFVMSNEPVVPTNSYRVRFSGSQVADITLFEVDAETQGDGKATVLPDGRILIPSDDDPWINVYGENGGTPVDQIPTEKGYRSLSYLEGSDELLAIPGTNNVDRIDLNGAILGTFDFTLDGLGGVWNFTLVPDGSERFVATNHNGPAASKSQIFVYDSTRLEELPLPAVLNIVGLSDFGDADGLATQLFDHTIVPVPTSVGEWSIH